MNRFPCAARGKDMTEVYAIIAACVALFAAGAVGALAIFASSMQLPIPGFKDKEAIKRTRGVRMAALVYDALFLLVVAAAAGSYVTGHSSTADYMLTPATTRNIYPLATIPLLVLFALGASSVLALHLSAVAPVMLTSAATGVAIFLHAQTGSDSPATWAFLVAGAGVSGVLTMALMFQIATTKMHPLHWASIGLYGVFAFVAWLLTFFTFSVNVFGQDHTIYYGFPAVAVGVGVIQAGLSLLASVRTCDMADADAEDDDEEPALELKPTKVEHVHAHARGHSRHRGHGM